MAAAQWRAGTCPQPALSGCKKEGGGRGEGEGLNYIQRETIVIIRHAICAAITQVLSHRSYHTGPITQVLSHRSYHTGPITQVLSHRSYHTGLECKAT